MTEVMNGAGNQFLPGTRFPQNHDRRICASHDFYLLKHVLQRGALRVLLNAFLTLHDKNGRKAVTSV